MSITVTKGYTFGSTEIVTNTKLHALVDSATIAGALEVSLTSEEQGDIVYRNGSAWVNLHHGTDGQVLTTKGNGANPEWATVSATDVTYTDAPSDVSASGIKMTLKAHANVAFGDVCYINSDGEAQLGDADAIATSSCVVMAIATINADASGSFLLHGIARNDAWNWTVGGLIYLTVTGTTGNTLSQTPPNATDDVVQILGVATHADRMYFNPNLVQVEVV